MERYKEKAKNTSIILHFLSMINNIYTLKCD